jgi:hypothetical protein
MENYMQQLFGQKVLNDFIQKQYEKLIENRWQTDAGDPKETVWMNNFIEKRRAI